MKGQYCSTVSSLSILLSPPLKVSATSSSSPKSKSSSSLKRRAISLSAISTALSVLIIPNSKSSCWSKPEFLELQNSGGVKALDLRIGDGDLPFDGDQVAIHYYGRLAAKQGWRFDSTYDHKDDTGESIPFIFILGSGKVIAGIEAAVRSMKVGGIRRIIIPPSQGYQNTSQEPIPPNFFDRQRLFTTIFNPTRLANGEGSTLGTLIFDIELVSLRHR
ncbi:hypothetical protein LOK49_LG09G02614 [Camellia lanceoleosa]|uniref:Uncharacterized protein n=1 Tax=Camellia lanceoleosa TaxID=1840588 RepID=A0ACC0GGQ5_9ERIC|nr:hypothetical protein LOK49_LG09G02614 [Camellia lanceoleosa]